MCFKPSLSSKTNQKKEFRDLLTSEHSTEYLFFLFKSFYTEAGPMNRHQFNRHIAAFEKNDLYYLISSRKNKSCLCYLISGKFP